MPHGDIRYSACPIRWPPPTPFYAPTNYICMRIFLARFAKSDEYIRYMWWILMEGIGNQLAQAVGSNTGTGGGNESLRLKRIPAGRAARPVRIS
jgi:hypothetical protein